MSINDVFLNCITEIKNLSLRNASSIVIGNLNLTSLLNNFDELRKIALKNLAVFVIMEIKLNDNFVTTLFLIIGFSVCYRLDWDRNGYSDDLYSWWYSK